MRGGGGGGLVELRLQTIKKKSSIILTELTWRPRNRYCPSSSETVSSWKDSQLSSPMALLIQENKTQKKCIKKKVLFLLTKLLKHQQTSTAMPFSGSPFSDDTKPKQLRAEKDSHDVSKKVISHPEGSETAARPDCIEWRHGFDVRGRYNTHKNGVNC